MKLVKNFVFAVLLALVLTVGAPAGELSTPGAASSPTPTPPPEGVMSTSDHGTVICDPYAASTETSDYLFYEALAALLSVY